MSKLAFVFPGQGAQYVGMGKDLWENFPYVKDLFEEANEVLGFDLKRLCFEGPESELKKTENTQVCVFLVSLASALVVEKELGLRPDYLAGHSLGEYTALCVAGVIPFREALRLVRKRGEFMRDSCPEGVGAMAALLGLERDRIFELCQKAKREGEVLVPANFNCPGQIVISGHKEAVERAISMVKEFGGKKAVLLEVSGAFHSPLMEEASKKLEEFLKGIEFNGFKVPVVSNVNAEPYSNPQKAKELLVLQVKSPVLWEDSIRRLVALGVNTFVELGPGKVLTGLIKRTVPELKTLNLEVSQDLEGLKEGLNLKIN